MSRPSQLPPRCPFQRKVITRPCHDPSPFVPPRAHESSTRHHRSLSQSDSLEKKPAWLDDLLSDSDSSPRRILHSRAASDPVHLFDDFVPNIALSSMNKQHLGSEESGNMLESNCMYGPNSPRRKSNVEFSDNSLLLALSDYVSQSSVQYIEDTSQSSRTWKDCDSPNDLNSEPKIGKRHPGQRSRARKLQYIAELERTVSVFQALESELGIRISNLLQQKVILSRENCNLKQQLTSLQQQKLIMDVEYQTLKKEAERLKLGLASCIGSKLYGSGDTDEKAISWQMLDWKKLHL